MECTRIQGEPFLTFDAEPLSPQAWRAVSGHSGICLAAELRGEALYPISRTTAGFVPDDLPQVLKYKGKTNADFTLLLLNCARAASAFANVQTPLIVADPLCGKATTLFCALERGDHAVGVELDAKVLAEADLYLERFLQFHHLKYRREAGSQTLRGGGNAKAVSYAIAQDTAQMKQGGARTLRLLHGDTLRLRELLGAESCHLLVGDLPYGVQHAPKEAGGISSLAKLVHAAMPGYAAVLKPGGAVALAFNTYTLKKTEVAHAMRDAGLEVLDTPPYDDFSHWVEQAVERDVLIGRKR
ncbi:MAG: hypothetical protein RSH26_06800 [Clostridia bacterium]